MSIQFSNYYITNTIPANNTVTSNDQSTNTDQTSNTNTPAANNGISNVVTYTLQQAQAYAQDLMNANQEITNVIQNAQNSPTHTIDTPRLENAQAQQILNFQLLQSAIQGLYTQLTPAQLQPLTSALSDTTLLLQQAQQTEKKLTQDTLNIRKLLAYIDAGNYTQTAQTIQPNQSTLPTLQTSLANARAQQQANAALLDIQIKALQALNTPTAQLLPLQNAYFESTQTLTDSDFNTDSINAYEQVYSPYQTSNNNNILFYLGLTPKPAAGSANANTWGSWVTLNADGTISTLNNPQALYSALTNLSNTYFPNYNTATNSFTLGTNNVLYPGQSPSPATISGENWANVQNFAIRMGYMPKANATTTPPATLPAYIQAIPNSNPTTYVVTLDPTPLQSMIGATAPFQHQTTPLTTSETTAWLKVFKPNVNVINLTGTVLHYPYIPDSSPNLILTQKKESILGLMTTMISSLKTDFLEPQQKAASVYTDFYNKFNSDVYNELSKYIKPTSKTDNTAGNYLKFEGNTFKGIINIFYGKYFDAAGKAKTDAPSAILYPPQTGTTISEKLPNGNTLTLADAIQWASSFGLSPAQVGTASSPGRCIMNYPPGTESYVVQIDPQPIQNMQNSNPPDGEVLIQTYQAWNTGFESEVSKLKNQLQLFAQAAQNALSTYQSRNDLFSSLISSLHRSLQGVIDRW